MTKDYDDRDVTSLAALLDFYSDRAIAHASFYLASLFGLFTVLQIAQFDYGSQCYWVVPYWVLFFVGFYTLARFNWYATTAQEITGIIRTEIVKEELRKRIDDIGDRITDRIPLMRLRTRITERLRTSLFYLIASGYSGIVLFACFLVFGDRIGVASIGLLAFVSLVYLLANGKSAND